MDYDTDGPAQVFSLAEAIGDEMTARGWTTDDLAVRMGPDPYNYAVAPLLLCVSSDGLKMTDDVFAGLARAFDVSEQFFRNLDATWRKWPERRSDYDAPDELFGPIAQRMFRLRDNDNTPTVT